MESEQYSHTESDTITSSLSEAHSEIWARADETQPKPRNGADGADLTSCCVIACEAAVTLSCPVLQLIDFLRRGRLQPHAVQSFLTFPNFHLFLHEPGEYQNISIFNICPYFKKIFKETVCKGYMFMKCMKVCVECTADREPYFSRNFLMFSFTLKWM